MTFPCLSKATDCSACHAILRFDHVCPPGRSDHQIDLSSLKATRQGTGPQIGTFSTVCMLVHLLSSLFYTAVWCRLAQCYDTVKGCLYENKSNVKSVKKNLSVVTVDCVEREICLHILLHDSGCTL